jgi:hypothetical protein
MLELGRAQKTIFIARYLSVEDYTTARLRAAGSIGRFRRILAVPRMGPPRDVATASYPPDKRDSAENRLREQR